MSDLLATVRQVADQAAAAGSGVVSLRALYAALGTEQPHHLTIHADRWELTHSCIEWCDVDNAVSRAPLVSSPHAFGRTYVVWLDDDGALRFREVQA